MDINTQESTHSSLPSFGENSDRDTLLGATGEEIDQALNSLEDPTSKEKMEQLRREQEAQLAQEVRELEEKNDKIVSKLMTRLMMEIIKLHPAKGEQVKPDSYLVALNMNYEYLRQLIEEAYPDFTAPKRNGLALHIYAKALDELQRSSALETARTLFMNEHQEESWSDEDSLPGEIERPLESGTSFKGFDNESPQASPAMFRLEDLQKGPASEKKSDVQKAA